MIYLPEIYPDELVYSWFCRYYIHSGCLTHKMALRDILYSRYNNPSKEFLGHLAPSMLEAMQRMYPIETMTLEHTMYPQYARFIPLEQKKNALYRMKYDFCDAHHLFAILPRCKDEQFLKYCPMCANEDKQRYGETYWHRQHQIRNMQICPTHHCRLVASAVTAKSEQTFTLCPAEFYVAGQNPIIETDLARVEYATYLANVFREPMDFDNNISISAVLYHAMQKTKYMKSSGKSRYTKQLSEDMQTYYEKLGISSIASMYQIQRALLGNRFDFSVVCQIAFYLGIAIKDLTSPTLTQEDIEKEQNAHYMKDRPAMDWTTYDAETAPILEQVARSIYIGTAGKSGRPERVSEKAVYRMMKLPGHRLEILPKCREIFNRYTESYEEAWARRIIWAFDKLQSEKSGKPFYWSDIRQLSGVKKSNVDAAIPYIRKHTTTRTADAIISLIGKSS